MKQSLEQIQSTLNGLRLPDNVTKGLDKTFTRLSEEVKNFEVLANKGVDSKTSFNKLAKSSENILTLFEKLKLQVKDLGNLKGVELEKIFPIQQANVIKKAAEAVKQYENRIKTLDGQITKNEKNLNQWKATLKEVQELKKGLSDSTSVQSSKASEIQSKFGISDLSDLEAARKKADEIEQKGIGKKGGWETRYKNQAEQLRTLINEYEQATQAVKQYQAALEGKDSEEDAQKKIEGLTKALERLKTTNAEEKNKALDDLYQQLKNIDGLNLDGAEKSIDKVKTAIQQYANEAGINLTQSLSKAGLTLDDLARRFVETGDNIDKSRAELERFEARARDVQALKSRIQYFFGLSNSINLVKRAIRGAFDTIKELDKAMTETAVVTDFSVSDMWEQLPEYTKRANELGVTTLAAYEAATLYYQQGLKTNEVNALSVETLKMARIAGLDAAEATDRMTNALRGFNMALTEANAQRVDDVYSELAANTASNVDEISTAMTKVASLAHNANMEFETTAAFLAQIIETTRESAETAGTALKTVVARFSEVKKLIDEGALRGTDEEGQVIDVNRVGAALRTAGIDLNKYFLGEVGLDDIFMELASKWDTLTSVQQRYIATQAAGSRQQSRFIALMQDYARTQELVGKAYNANGASARQFAKTQESLESKLNKLKNAWNEFLMGLTNSTIVKGFVDLLTDLLNGINKVTSAFGDGVGSILKWGTALAGIAGGKKLFNSVGFDSLLSIFSGKDKEGNAIAGLKERVTKFKADSVNYKGNKATSTKGSPIIGATGTTGTKTLFGALGNKFVSGTKWGANIAGATGLGGAGSLALALGQIAVAAAAAYAVVKTLYDLTPAGQAKIAAKYADTLNDLADSAKEAESNIKQIQKDYKDKTIAIETTVTVSEQNKAIEERNEYIKNLLEQDATYAKYISSTIDKSGRYVLTLDEDALAAAADKAAKAAVDAAINASLGQAAAADTSAKAIFGGGSLSTLERMFTFDFGQHTDMAGITDIDSFQRYLEQNKDQYRISDERYAKYLGYIDKYRDASDTALQESANAFKMALGDSIDETTKDLISSVAANNFNGADYTKELRRQSGVGLFLGNDFWHQGRNKIEYEQLYGQGSSAGKSAEDIALALAARDIKEGETQKVNDLANLLKGPQGEDYKRIFEEYAGQFDFSKIALDVETIEAEDYDLGLDEDKIAKIASLLEKSSDAIKEEIKNRRLEAAQLQQQTRGNLYQKLFEAGVTLGINKDTQVQEQIKAMSPEQQQATLDAITGAQNLLSPELFKQFSLDAVNGNFNIDRLKDFSEFFKSINLDDPIRALKTLNSVAEDSPFEDYAEDIRTANEELFSTSNLVQSFIASADYEGLTEQLSEFIKENGQLTGQNIQDLAKDCSKLNDLLEVSEVNVYGLAKAFTLIETGVLEFNNLTDGMLKAFSATMSLSDAIDELSKFIADFDAGRDFGEGADFFHKQAEDLQEFVEGYEFGNERTQTIYDALFGEGAYKKFMETNWEKGPEKVAELMAQKISDRDYLMRDNSYGFMDTMAGMGERTFGTITRDKNNPYDFEWDIGTQTTEDLITNIRADFEARGESISRAAAESIISGWASQSWDFAEDLNTNNFNAAVEKWAEDLSNTSIVSQEQLDAFAKAFHKTGDEVLATLGTIKGEAKVPIVVTWSDEDGNPLTGAELKDRWDEYVKAGTIDESQFLSSTGVNGKRTVDIDKLLEVGASAGLSSDKIAQVADQYVADLNNALLTKKVTIPNYEIGEDGTVTVTKDEIEVSADSFEGLTQAENMAMEKANYEMVGQLIATQDYSGIGNSIKAAAEAGAAEAGPSVKNIIESYIKAIQATVGVTVNIESGEVEGQGATGGIVRSLAKGSASHWLQPGFALTGEEGPEIVWNKEKGYSYITGKNGPEYQNLQPGDRVFNAQETSRILKNSGFAKGGLFGSYSKGAYNPNKLTNNKSGGGGGSGSKDSKKESTWRNELDWLYDLMEDIAEYERQQSIIQAKYDLYLKDISKTGKDLFKLTQKELVNLETQLDAQQAAQTKRLQQMMELQTLVNAKGYNKYVQYNQNDRTLEIDWDKIEAIKNKDVYDEVTDWISRMESVQDQMDNAEDAIWDIKKQIQELQNRYLQKYLDFQNKVLDAVVKQYQDTIDNLSELNDTLNNTNAQILDSIQREIDLERQIRDNTDTEKNIADLEARLAYLQRDTTGANATEIRSLQQQLDEAREQYSDTLIDQAIDRLSQVNEDSSEQREKQIELMQAQLEYWQESGGLWEEVAELIATGFTEQGTIIQDSDLWEALRNSDDWDAMSEAQKKNWADELILETNEVGAHLIQLSGGNDVNTTLVRESIAEVGGSLTQSIDAVAEDVRALVKKTGTLGGTPEHSYTAEKVEGYASGGLTTKTSLALLHGTPSEPEYVLNARQTEAFLKLSDILPTIMNSGITTNNNNNVYDGDISFNVSVNVDNISNDYDVDRLVERIKDDLYDAASYRNGNVLGFIR